MNASFHRFPVAALGVAALLALQGCGTTSVSKEITDDGKSAQVVFPKIDNAARLKEGTFPNLDNLRAVAPGVTKDQLYDLLGPPHFREGMAGPREWDYVFNFRKTGGAITTCQYKVIFDKGYQAQSFYWLPAGCSEVLAVAKPVAPARPETPVAATRSEAPPVAARTTTLAADGLFRFGGGAAADLLPKGRREIEALAANMKGGFKSLSTVDVTGHTDRLGSDNYNDALSLARAKTVRELLMAQGIDGRIIQARGMGKRQPVAQCPGARQTAALVDCLQPNRRVDIKVSGV